VDIVFKEINARLYHLCLPSTTQSRDLYTLRNGIATTHSSGLTDLMLGTHVCMGITYKSKYYRISHIAYHLLNRISANFQPSPPSFLNITLYVAVAPPKLPLSYLVVAGPAQTTPRCRQLASPP